MPVTIARKAGSFCDVVPHPDGFAFVWQNGGSVNCQVNGVLRWGAFTVAGLYLRAATGPGGVVGCAFQSGHDGSLTVVIEGVVTQHGTTFGQNVCGLYHDGSSFVVLVQRAGDLLHRLRVPSGQLLEQISIPPTSQGFRDVRPDGTYVLGDHAHSTTRHGWTFWQPMTRAFWTVGQREADIGIARDDQVYVAGVIPGAGYEPHVAVQGSVVAVCARTPSGATLAMMTQPYPAHEPVPGPVEPPIEPPIEPEPEPEPEMPSWTSNHQHVLNQFAEKFGIPIDTGDDAARDWAHELCEQFRYTFGAQYGHKKADNGRPHSADAVAFQDGGRLYCWDVLRDAGGPDCELVDNPATQEITGQVFEVVDAINHLAGSTHPPDPGPTPPQPQPPGGQHCWSPSDALFHDTLKLIDDCAKKWRGLHVPPGTPNGHLLLDQGQCHIWFYRLFVEGWKPQDIYNAVE